MNKSNPKVSILMCVYNGEVHLREAMESILEQTFKDFEFVIVDDGSTDSSWQILTEYSTEDSRIVLIRNEENLGLEKSLNKGLAATQGEYVARQDADDISLPNRLQLQTNFLDTHREVGALGSSLEFINKQGVVLRKKNLPVDHESLQAFLLINNCLWPSMMIRRSLMQKLGGYNEKMLYAEDYDLYWRISCNSRLATLPDILLRYRSDNASSISKLKRKQQLQCALRISFKAVQDSLAEKATIDERVYERFWWALLDRKSYQKYWDEDQGRSRQLQLQDIQHLQPLWQLLATHPGGVPIWGPRLRNLALSLLRNRQIVEGFQLLWIVVSHFWIKEKGDKFFRKNKL